MRGYSSSLSPFLLFPTEDENFYSACGNCGPGRGSIEELAIRAQQTQNRGGLFYKLMALYAWHRQTKEDRCGW